MSWKKLTAAVIVGTTAALIGYDVLACDEGGEEATISWNVWSWAKAFPLVGFAAGILCGHFFWQMQKKAVCEEA